MVRGATPVKRGCGSRVAGGIYAEVGLSPHGRPLEDFLIDPPQRVNAAMAERMGIKDIGVGLMPREVDGRKVTYILDVVGQEHYPTPADFLEEVRRFGLSRRLPKNLDFGQITGETRIVLLHRRGWLGNAQAYYQARHLRMWTCPKGLTEHVDPQNPPLLCASLWWEDGPDGKEPPAEHRAKLAEQLPPEVLRRIVWRQLPAFGYYTLLRPAGVKPEHDLAMIASFPLSRLAVVRDAAGGTHEEALDRARKADLPVDLAEN